MTGIVARVDDWLRGTALGVYEFFTLGIRATRFVFARPFYWRDTLTHMDRMGVGSVPILLLTGLFTGMVLALQSAVALERFGADIYVGSLVGASMVRELGPVLAALIFAGRVGSGIAAEIGAMRVTEQIDALQSFGTDPIKKLVTPRLLAGLIMLPLLTIMTVDFAIGMLAESGLSFLGIGIQPPEITWGLMVAQGRNYLSQAWWLAFFPGLAIMLATLSANILSNWVRIVTDPVQRWRLEAPKAGNDG